MTERTCSVDDCHIPARKRGYCKLHYERWYRYRDPTKGRQVATRPTEICKEDGCGLPVEGRGLCSTHYTRLRLTGRVTLAPKPLKPTCSAEGCERQVQGRGLCGKHYQRLRNSGTTDERAPLGPMPQCAAEGCEKLARGRKSGLCNLHYDRMRRKGTLELPAPPDLKAALAAAVSATPSDGCLIWQHNRDPDGYARAGQKLVHREVCRQVHGEPPTGKPNALHRCGRGHEGCVAWWHLYWGDWKDNSEDSRAHGTLSRGSRHPGAKLTEADINPIRRAAGPQTEIALRYGVSRTTISLIQNGKIWKHVPWE